MYSIVLRSLRRLLWRAEPATVVVRSPTARCPQRSAAVALIASVVGQRWRLLKTEPSDRQLRLLLDEFRHT